MFGLGTTEILIFLLVLLFGCGGAGVAAILIALYFVKRNRGEK